MRKCGMAAVRFGISGMGKVAGCGPVGDMAYQSVGGDYSIPARL